MANGEPVAMRPLPIWPHDSLTEEARAKIVSAKKRISTPVLAQFAKGVPGSDRVLCIGEKPPFACDHALVRDIDSPGLTDAIAYVLHITDDKRAFTVADWLSETLGGKVTEVTDAVQRSVDNRAESDDGERGPKPATIAPGSASGNYHAARPDDPRGPIDPNSYSEGNYRAALRAARETAT